MNKIKIPSATEMRKQSELNKPSIDKKERQMVIEFICNRIKDATKKGKTYAHMELYCEDITIAKEIEPLFIEQGYEIEKKERFSKALYTIRW